MWPFDHKEQESLMTPKTNPFEDPQLMKVLALENRLLEIELAIVEICNAIKMNNEFTDNNFKTMEGNFQSLVKYVMAPRASIMGEPKDKN